MRALTMGVKRARSLRREMTPPEAMLWTRLRARVGGPVFRRQHPIGPYVLDFFCAKASLAIEVDGAGHGHGDQPDKDRRRDAWLSEQGVEVLRITAGDVLKHPDEMADSVWRAAAARLGRT